jgi:hypothetical protein
MLKKIISGGQTGVDRAGLDAALKAGIPIGGYCPKGRLAEDGTIPLIYPLVELASPESHYRTEQNVINSDGTLILNRGDLSQGTKLTHFYAVEYGKPCLIVQLDNRRDIDPKQAVRWIQGHFISTLNVAGPRESKHPGIYQEALSYMEKLLAELRESLV